jgi:hypothetical protein
MQYILPLLLLESCVPPAMASKLADLMTRHADERDKASDERQNEQELIGRMMQQKLKSTMFKNQTKKKKDDECHGEIRGQEKPVQWVGRSFSAAVQSCR